MVHEKRFYTLPHAAHGAIEDGLKVWEDVESIWARNFSSKAATSARFLKKMLVALIVFADL